MATTLYRIHDRLVRQSGGEIPKGCVSDLSMLGANVIGLLLRRKTISVVQAPPLDVFPAWKVRAERLAAAGIGTVEFITMDANEIVDRVLASADVRWQPAKVEDWKSDVKARLGIGEPVARP